MAPFKIILTGKGCCDGPRPHQGHYDYQASQSAVLLLVLQAKYLPSKTGQVPGSHGTSTTDDNENGNNFGLVPGLPERTSNLRTGHFFPS